MIRCCFGMVANAYLPRRGHGTRAFCERTASSLHAPLFGTLGRAGRAGFRMNSKEGRTDSASSRFARSRSPRPRVPASDREWTVGDPSLRRARNRSRASPASPISKGQRTFGKRSRTWEPSPHWRRGVLYGLFRGSDRSTRGRSKDSPRFQLVRGVQLSAPFSFLALVVGVHGESTGWEKEIHCDLRFGRAGSPVPFKDQEGKTTLYQQSFVGAGAFEVTIIADFPL